MHKDICAWYHFSDVIIRKFIIKDTMSYDGLSVKHVN